MSPLLQISNLTTWFHTKSGVIRAVDGIDLTVGRGRTVGLIGESGSGKSVTALSIMGLVDPPGRVEAGSSIDFEGTELVGLDERRFRSIRGNDIGMIFQEPMSSLNPVYTIGYQIAEAIRAHETTVSRRQARSRAVEMLALVGIPDPDKRVDVHPHEMSGGMRQRVMIAIALACSPRLLIADEPTTALDVTIQAQILALLADLRERLDMSVLLITHDLAVVAQVADDVAVMYAGQIVERGSSQSVFEHPQHPYTEALLGSIPALGMTQSEPLRVITGSVPSPIAWPRGCRFAPRCDHAFDLCRERDPCLHDADGQTSAACWLRLDAPHESPPAIPEPRR